MTVEAMFVSMVYYKSLIINYLNIFKMKIRFISTIFLCLFSFFLRAQDSIKTVELKHWKEHVLYDDSLYSKQINSQNLIKDGMKRELAEFLFLSFNPNLRKKYERNPAFYKKQIAYMMEPAIYEVHAGMISFEIMFPSDRFVKNGWNSFLNRVSLAEIKSFLKD